MNFSNGSESTEKWCTNSTFIGEFIDNWNAKKRGVERRWLWILIRSHAKWLNTIFGIFVMLCTLLVMGLAFYSTLETCPKLSPLPKTKHNEDIPVFMHKYMNKLYMLRVTITLVIALFRLYSVKERRSIHLSTNNFSKSWIHIRNHTQHYVGKNNISMQFMHFIILVLAFRNLEWKNGCALYHPGFLIEFQMIYIILFECTIYLLVLLRMSRVLI